MLLIENGYMIDPKSGREGKYDILTEKNQIIKIGKRLRQEIEENMQEDLQIIDASGLP